MPRSFGYRWHPRAVTVAMLVWAPLFIASPSFADDEGTVAPVSAETGGSSTAGAAAGGTSDSGNSAAAATVSNDSSATVDQGSSTANASTTTSGAAAAVQASGSIEPPSPPTPAPTVAEVTSTEETPPEIQQQSSEQQPVLETTLPSGSGQASAAGAATQATAEAHNEGDVPVASATASAQAGGIAVQIEAAPAPSLASTENTEELPTTEETQPEERTYTETSETVPAVSLAVTGSEVQANAYAAGGDKPTAFASTDSDNFALAVGGDKPSAQAEAGPNALKQSSNDGNEAWEIAFVATGQYSVAVATHETATAFSSIYGGGGAFTVDDVWAAALTWASAYATANKLSASAWAKAGAVGAAGTPEGIAAAASASKAGASITIEIRPKVNGGTAGTSASAACTLKSVEWEFLRKVRKNERWRYLDCACPTGWHLQTANKLVCIRNEEAFN